MSERTKADIISDINTVIEKYVLPAVGQHGGTVSVLDFNTDTGVLTLQLGGACSGCAGSKMTLKNGVEKMIFHYVPEVKSIEAEDDAHSEVDPYFSHPIDYPSANDMLDELNHLSKFVGTDEDKKI
jgi:Fe-S cluster biogenesis protein NfuA